MYAKLVVLKTIYSRIFIFQHKQAAAEQPKWVP